jgi:GNAT superfamily N-acetyltransferase
MEIRQALPGDAEPIERIRIRGWQTAYRDAFPAADLDAMPVDPTRWEAFLAASGTPQRCYVCEREGRIAGWITIGVSDRPAVGEIHGLYVDPDAWSHGVGRTLIGFGESELARDYANAVLWTLEVNARARRFYEAGGWTLDGTRASFDRFGVSASQVRYAKALSSSTSRA